jgi:hypothetical protein
MEVVLVNENISDSWKLKVYGKWKLEIENLEMKVQRSD